MNLRQQNVGRKIARVKSRYVFFGWDKKEEQRPFWAAAPSENLEGFLRGLFSRLRTERNGASYRGWQRSIGALHMPPEDFIQLEIVEIYKSTYTLLLKLSIAIHGITEQ